MKLLAALLLSLVVFFFPTKAYPQTTFDDEEVIECPAQVVLNVPQYVQAEPVWCWVTTTQMALVYRNGSAPYQCRLVEVALGVPPGFCCSRPGFCQVAGQNMGSIRRLLDFYGVSSTYWPGQMSAQGLYDELEIGNPVIMQYKSGITSSHVVVLRAMKWQVIKNKCVPFVGVNDPLSFFSAWVPYSTVSGTLWVDSLIVE